MPSIKWEELRAPQLPKIASEGALVVWPIGSIEQHGPHLPVVTDSLIAEKTAEAAAELASIKAVIAPTCQIALSSEHLHAPGTISLPPSLVLETAQALARAVKLAGFTKLAILNGHGGNSAILRVAIREIRVTLGLDTFLLHPHLPKDQGGDGESYEIHAGFGETSIMAWLRPDLVDLERLESSEPTWLEEYEQIGFGKPVAMGWTSADFGATGVIGNPVGANPEIGEKLFRKSVENVAAALCEIGRFSFDHQA
jgi:creatinine amidohydrolase